MDNLLITFPLTDNANYATLTTPTNSTIIYQVNTRKGLTVAVREGFVGKQTQISNGFSYFGLLNSAGKSISIAGGNRGPCFKTLYRGQSVDHSDPDPQRVYHGERESGRIPTTAVTLIRIQPKMYAGDYPTGKGRRGWVKPGSLVKRVTDKTYYGQYMPDSFKVLFLFAERPVNTAGVKVERVRLK